MTKWQKNDKKWQKMTKNDKKWQKSFDKKLTNLKLTSSFDIQFKKIDKIDKKLTSSLIGNAPLG